MKTIVGIMLNWNRAELTFQAAMSLQHQLPDNAPLIIVDNGSDEQEFVLLQSLFRDISNIQIFRLTENKGPGPGINFGLEMAIQLDTDLILMMHNDTFLTDGSLEQLVLSMEEDRTIGATGALQVYWERSQEVYFAGGRFLKPGFIPRHLGRGRALDTYGASPNYHVDWLEFTCVIFRAETVRSIGLPRANFEFYWEDAEWCIRAKRNGWNLKLCPKAVVKHMIGATLGTGFGSSYYSNMVYNHRRTIQLHGNLIDQYFATLYWLTKALRLLVLSDFESSRAIFKAIKVSSLK